MQTKISLVVQGYPDNILNELNEEQKRLILIYYSRKGAFCAIDSLVILKNADTKTMLTNSNLYVKTGSCS